MPSPSGSLLSRTTFTYDGTFKGFLTSQTTDLEGGLNLTKSTSYTPDALTGNIDTKTETIQDPRNGIQTRVTEYEYDTAGNRTLEKLYTASGSRSTTFEYDNANRLIRVNYPQSGNGPEFIEMGYDSRSNKIFERNEKGNYVFHVYDNTNRRVRQIIDMDGSEGQSTGDLIAEYTYNAVGSLTGTTSPEGRNTFTTYDALQRPLTQTVGGRTTQFDYDSHLRQPQSETHRDTTCH